MVMNCISIVLISRFGASRPPAFHATGADLQESQVKHFIDFTAARLRVSDNARPWDLGNLNSRLRNLSDACSPHALSGMPLHAHDHSYFQLVVSFVAPVSRARVSRWSLPRVRASCSLFFRLKARRQPGRAAGSPCDTNDQEILLPHHQHENEPSNDPDAFQIAGPSRTPSRPVRFAPGPDGRA
jgi:hypothetical protein